MVYEDPIHKRNIPVMVIGSVLASIASNTINYCNLSVALACSNGIWYGISLNIRLHQGNDVYFCSLKYDYSMNS